MTTNYWKRYFVTVTNPDTNERVLGQWFTNFDVIKSEVQELSDENGWDGYNIDIREYRHNPNKWIWRAKL